MARRLRFDFNPDILETFGSSIFEAAAESVTPFPLMGTKKEIRLRIRAACPAEPGVYGMVNAENELFYVGMSRCLQRRLQTYFSSRTTRRKECRTGRAARMVVWQPVAHPLIAVLRETELIRRFLPTRNVQGHPHRTRPGYLVLADHAAGWFHTSYQIPKRHAGVWGPLPINRRTREAANVLNQVFRLRDCPPATRMQFRGEEPLFETDAASSCLRAEMGTCLAPCVGACSRRQYSRAVGDAKRFLNGTSSRILDQLREQMQQASANCLFEKAARIRDALTILERIDVQLRRFHDWVDSATFAYPLRESRPARAVPWMIVVRGRIQILSTVASSRRDVRRLLKESARQNTGAFHVPDEFEVARLLHRWFRRHPTEWKRTLRLSRSASAP